MANLVTFAKKLWKDKVGGNTPITAAELNRMEGGISDCATQINKLGDSVSHYSIKTAEKVEFECQRVDNMERCVIRFYLNDTDFLAINFGYNKNSKSRDVCLYSSTEGRNLFSL